MGIDVAVVVAHAFPMLGALHFQPKCRKTRRKERKNSFEEMRREERRAEKKRKEERTEEREREGNMCSTWHIRPAWHHIDNSYVTTMSHIDFNHLHHFPSSLKYLPNIWAGRARGTERERDGQRF